MESSTVMYMCQIKFMGQFYYTVILFILYITPLSKKGCTQKKAGLLSRKPAFFPCFGWRRPNHMYMGEMVRAFGFYFYL